MAKYVMFYDDRRAQNTSVRLGDASIPFDRGNTDFIQFLTDWKAGAEVLNADGTPAPYVAPETP